MEPLLLETPFGISIDFTFWQNIFTLTVAQQISAIFAVIIWWIIIIALFKKVADRWMKTKQKEYLATLEWCVLAVDIPAQFVQSPKAVEQIFTHLSGALTTYGVYDRYFLGKLPKWFSFEIVSIEGYIQFLVRTEVEFRDLVEAAIYAQYSEAEITEVEDYVTNIPAVFPNENYEAQGMEFSLLENEVYPIRTYPEFEYNISKDVVFADPMAALLENFSRVGMGENLWMQIAVVPVENSWKAAGIDLVKKLISGKKDAPKKTVMNYIGSAPELVLKTAIQAWTYDFSSGDAIKKEESVGKVSDLTPGTKAVIESIENKISKIGFKSSIRVLYVSRKDSFKPHKCLAGIIGSLNQFSVNNRNGFVSKALSGNKIVSAYRDRILDIDSGSYILNIEELATVWHFPLPLVKTPLLQKADIKRSEPPINLPVENYEMPLKTRPISGVSGGTAKTNTDDGNINLPPMDLPYA